LIRKHVAVGLAQKALIYSKISVGNALKIVRHARMGTHARSASDLLSLIKNHLAVSLAQMALIYKAIIAKTAPKTVTNARVPINAINVSLEAYLMQIPKNVLVLSTTSWTIKNAVPVKPIVLNVTKKDARSAKIISYLIKDNVYVLQRHSCLRTGLVIGL